MIIDTQIVSYWFKGSLSSKLCAEIEVSSITASEFLLFQTQENNKPDYYILPPKQYEFLSQAGMITTAKNNKKWAKMGSHRTDSFTIDFGNYFSPYKVFGNDAIADIINSKKYEAFKLSISHLPKQKQKYLKKRIEFIFDNAVQCYPTDANTIEQAMELFIDFDNQYSAKENIKNTINDILILSTAVTNETKIYTEDKLLNRFALEKFSVPSTELEKGVEMDFSSSATAINKESSESKAYINKGWSFSMRKGNSVAGA